MMGNWNLLFKNPEIKCLRKQTLTNDFGPEGSGMLFPSPPATFKVSNLEEVGESFSMPFRLSSLTFSKTPVKPSPASGFVTSQSPNLGMGRTEASPT